MLIYLSAGEHSGDMHGATLARELHSLNPGAALLGMGGPLMRQAGVEILVDPTAKSTIGFVEALKNLGHYRRLLANVVAALEKRRPDLVIWIDFGGFNLALAKACKRMGIPVLCVFSPSAWAYGSSRAKLMAERITELAAVLPFEADFYRRYHIKTTFVGHPLVDLVCPNISPDGFRANLGAGKDDLIIPLLPGSRQNEIRAVLPVMLSAAAIMTGYGGSFRFLLPLAPSIPLATVRPYIERSGVKVEVTSGGAYNALAAGHLAMIASGTATLEAGIIGTPFITVYRVSSISFLIYRLLRNRSDWGKPVLISLPNLIAGRLLVPELLQKNLNPSSLAAEAGKIIRNSALHASMIAGLRETKRALGPPGAMRRVAEIALRLADH